MLTCAECGVVIEPNSTLLLKANYRAVNYKPKFPNAPQYVIVGDNFYHKGCW